VWIRFFRKLQKENSEIDISESWKLLNDHEKERFLNTINEGIKLSSEKLPDSIPSLDKILKILGHSKRTEIA